MLRFLVIGINDNPQPAFTDEVKRVIDGGKVFSGGLRHHEIVGNVLPDGAKWIDITVPLSDVYRQYRDVDGKIIIFASGDPLFFGFATTLQREFPDVDIKVYPTFNSLQTLAHRIVMSYHDMIIVSLTGRPWNAFDAALIEGRNKIGILTDRQHTPSAIAERMLHYGYVEYQMYVGEHLGNTEVECVARYSLEEAATTDFSFPNCLIITKNNNSSFQMGLPDNAFAILDGRPKMITKMPIRLLSIQALGLSCGSVLWDIGFCTGSISIEAKRMYPSIDVVAFEIREEGRELMEENTRRFRTPGITTVIGDFMEQDVTTFPQPTSVFIGGHGGKIVQIVARVAQMLPKGGIVVMNSVSEKSRTRFIGACQMFGLSLVSCNSIQLNDYNKIDILKCVKQ
ncbi:MAG: precorrin-6y C5,15-methyltransferase (decarboxylating) subunit CbiE [Prevotella sp.]|nr:precorrin-6y C5,15-methyltransferase (decarboxylating) subunit CbiE [Prevotella sp.]